MVIHLIGDPPFWVYYKLFVRCVLGGKGEGILSLTHK